MAIYCPRCGFSSQDQAHGTTCPSCKVALVDRNQNTLVDVDSKVQPATSLTEMTVVEDTAGNTTTDGVDFTPPSAAQTGANLPTQVEDTKTSPQAKTKAIVENEAIILQIGDVINQKYKIASLLGKGGMGAVYKVEHLLLPHKKYFALKVLHPELSQTGTFRKRFLREVEMAMEFTHEHAVPIRDFGQTEQGHQYFTMDFSPGLPLKEVIEKSALAEERALVITKQVLSALKNAHAKGIVHRDLKPANILIEDRAGQDHALVLDFGIAKAFSEEENQQLTKDQQIVGTPHYMAPEQAQGGKVDTRTDIYALGVILYEMVTGQLPFSGNSGMDILVGHIYKPVPPPRQVKPGISVATERLILKALEKKPDDRFASTEEFIAAIEKILTGKDKNAPGARRLSSLVAILIIGVFATAFFFLYEELKELREEKKTPVVTSNSPITTAHPTTPPDKTQPTLPKEEPPTKTNVIIPVETSITPITQQPDTKQPPEQTKIGETKVNPWPDNATEPKTTVSTPTKPEEKSITSPRPTDASPKTENAGQPTLPTATRDNLGEKIAAIVDDIAKNREPGKVAVTRLVYQGTWIVGPWAIQIKELVENALRAHTAFSLATKYSLSSKDVATLDIDYKDDDRGWLLDFNYHDAAQPVYRKKLLLTQIGQRRLPAVEPYNLETILKAWPWQKQEIEGPFTLAMTTERGQTGAVYRAEEYIRIEVKASQSCYLQVYEIQADGTILRIFPNQFNKDASKKECKKIQAGRVYTIFPPESEYTLPASETGCMKIIHAIACEKPLPERIKGRHKGQGKRQIDVDEVSKLQESLQEYRQNYQVVETVCTIWGKKD